MQIAKLKPNESNMDHIAELGLARTSYDVFRVIKNYCLGTGFTKFIIMRLPEGEDVKIGELAIITNWDPELIGGYDSMQLAVDSPMFSALKKSTLPHVWRFGDAITTRCAERTERAAALFGEFGIKNGVFFHLVGPSGQRGAVGLSGDRSDPANHELMEMSFVAAHAFEALCNLDIMQPKTVDTLTDREKECIYWTACGKTSSEVGEILKISDNTVNNYLASAAMKLETANKAHTVAKAIRYGLLEQY